MNYNKEDQKEGLKMTTKKDYMKVAKIIKDEAEHYGGQDIREKAPQVAQVLINIQNELADLFESDNNKFDRDKFYNACAI